MTPLGKALVFYLKYMAEMNHLCHPEKYGDEPDLTGLNDAEQVRKMACTVGAAASGQAAEFLQLCGKGIEAHFTGLGNAKLANKANRATVVQKWRWHRRVYGSSSRDGWFVCGVSLSGLSDIHIPAEKDVCGLIVPYLYLRGARNRADAIWNTLGTAPHPCAGAGLVEDNRIFILASIPIMARPTDGFDADRDPLIAEVMKTIARIGAEQTRAIASIAAGLKEPDET
jgi:hypothetical protein